MRCQVTAEVRAVLHAQQPSGCDHMHPMIASSDDRRSASRTSCTSLDQLAADASRERDSLACRTGTLPATTP